MQNAAFRALRLDALYAPFEVPPAVLKPVLRGMVMAGVEGLNVTVPLKEAVMPCLSALDPAARSIGAVNTIVIRNRKLTGYNTDGVGFRAALLELGWKPRHVRAVVLGAGGAARAVIGELARCPSTVITIANRHPEKAQRLARWARKLFPKTAVEYCALKAAPFSGMNLLVNTTSLGMKHGDPSPVAALPLHRDLLVYDLVYNRQTALLKAARKAGCVAQGGLSMLLYQGVAAFQLWTGRKAPVAAMRKALAAAFKESGG